MLDPDYLPDYPSVSYEYAASSSVRIMVLYGGICIYNLCAKVKFFAHKLYIRIPSYRTITNGPRPPEINYFETSEWKPSRMLIRMTETVITYDLKRVPKRLEVISKC